MQQSVVLQESDGEVRVLAIELALSVFLFHSWFAATDCIGAGAAIRALFYCVW